VARAGKKAKAALPRHQRRRYAWRIVYRHMAWAGGVGLVPVPLFDQIVIGSLLGKMLAELFDLYGVEVTEHKMKTILAAVLGGAHTEWLSGYVLGYVERYLPGVPRTAIRVTRPVMAAAVTYALGWLFLQHLDAGAWRSNGSPVGALPPALSLPTPVPSGSVR
jgi:uncharacterized protein (DUF697 family)